MNIIFVTGANGGLGQALMGVLAQSENSIVHGIMHKPSAGSKYGDDLIHCRSDFTKEEEVLETGEWIRRAFKNDLEVFGIDRKDAYPILINCAGVNYIEWFDQLNFSQFDRLMSINVKAGIQLVQSMIGVKPPLDAISEDDNLFCNGGCVLNIVSNASHVPMTNSVFYNASKGAFHIATLAMARELRKTHGITIFGISPNKLRDTGMSAYIEDRVPGLRGWSPEEAKKYQLSALPAGEETDPEELARFIGYLLEEPRRHKYLTNTIIPYGA